MTERTTARPILTKALSVRVKAAGPGEDSSLGEGEFTALVSVFDNVDTYGDVVMPGAFTDTLKAYADKGDPLPIVWSHDWTDPFSHIGWAEAAKCVETAEGLVVTAQLDVDSPVPEAAARAQQVFRLLKGRRVTSFSFAFDVLEGGWGVRGEGDDSREVFELRKLDLHEAGPCLVGVNRATELQDVKAAEAVRRLLTGKATGETAPKGTSTTETGTSQDPDERATDEPRSKSAATFNQDPASVAVLASLIELEQED